LRIPMTRKPALTPPSSQSARVLGSFGLAHAPNRGRVHAPDRTPNGVKVIDKVNELSDDVGHDL
jgi:hypothetical protein